MNKWNWSIFAKNQSRARQLAHGITPGIYTFRPSIFEFTAKLKRSPRGEYELTDAIRDLAHSGKKVKALELTGEWADVRDPDDVWRMNSMLSAATVNA